MSSLPLSFITHYQKILGTEKSSVFFDYCQKPLRKSLRVNTLKTSVANFLEQATQESWNLAPVEWCETGFFIDRENNNAPIGHTLQHALGEIYIQESSSMIPVEALFWGHEEKNFAGKIVGDIAASPGSKTTHIACKMQGNGTILANELSASRLKALYSNIERCGAWNVILTHYDGANLCQLLPETFDFLLLDAPCTGEGTVRKNFDALKNWNPEDAKRMSILQKKLILSAFSALKENGEMVYSTCTLGREENQEVVEYLQQNFPESVEIISLKNLFPTAYKACTPEGFLHVFPEIYDSEGFFVAKIKKIKKTSEAKRLPELKKFPFTPLSKTEEKHIEELFNTQWGYHLPKEGKLWKRSEEIWFFPAHTEKMVCRIRANRSGICLGTIHKGKWKTCYEAVTCFGRYWTQNIFNCNTEEAFAIWEGKNLEKDVPDGIEVIAKYNDLPVAIGRMQNGTWKNNLPRELVGRMGKN